MNPSHSWKFYNSSKEAFDALLNALSSASDSIFVEFFIIENDEIGHKFTNLLIEKAKQGLEVKIILDSVGSYKLVNSPTLNALKNAGVETIIFNPITPWHPNRESYWYFRDHSKLIIIDRKIGFTGGLCIGKIYESWRDTFVEIKGEIVEKMIKKFEFMWHKDYKNPEFLFKKQKEPTQYDFLYIMNVPLPKKRYIYYELVRAIKKARHSIKITTPYFLPDHRLVRIIKKALKRKVEVSIIVPQNTNSKLVDIGAKSFFDEFLEAGAKIFLYQGMIHSKVVTVDTIFSTVGSLNMDNVSLRYNFEGNIVSSDKEFTKCLINQFNIDISKSINLTLDDWKKRGLTNIILEMIVWPIRKLL